MSARGRSSRAATCQARGTSRSGGSRARSTRSPPHATPRSWSTAATVRGRSWRARALRRKGFTRITVSRWPLLTVAEWRVREERSVAWRSGARWRSATQSATQSTREVSPRITRLEAWLSAIAQHRPGALDEAVRRVNALNQEQLRLVWIDVSTIVSLIREPGVNLFYVNEPVRRRGSQSRQVYPLATARSSRCSIPSAS